MPASSATNPLDNLYDTVAMDTQSWSDDESKAWVYGVIVGWDEETTRALALRFGWSPLDVQRLESLRRRFESLRGE